MDSKNYFKDIYTDFFVGDSFKNDNAIICENKCDNQIGSEKMKILFIIKDLNY